MPRASPPPAARCRGTSVLRRAARGLGLSSAALVLGACLCPPSSRELLDASFRTPEQTFRTFQTAVRADDPELEYRCLSSGFRSRNGLSKLAWRESRAELRRRYPWLRTGIAKAEIVRVEADVRRARVEAESFGRSIAVELVREDFAQLWAGAELVLDREAPFEEWVAVQPASGGPWLTGGVPLPAGRDGSDITELRLGREWKIDDLMEADDAARSPTQTP